MCKTRGMAHGGSERRLLACHSLEALINEERRLAAACAAFVRVDRVAPEYISYVILGRRDTPSRAVSTEASDTADSLGEIYSLGVAGDLDLVTAPLLQCALRKDIRLSPAQRSILLDISATRYMDSVGFGVLVGIAGWLAEQGKRLYLIGATAPVRRNFQTLCAENRIYMKATLDEAIADLG